MFSTLSKAEVCTISFLHLAQDAALKSLKQLFNYLVFSRVLAAFSHSDKRENGGEIKSLKLG